MGKEIKEGEFVQEMRMRFGHDSGEYGYLDSTPIDSLIPAGVLFLEDLGDIQIHGDPTDMKCAKSLLALALLATSVSARPGTPDTSDWPQWRGPNRDGISTDTGLLKEWPKEGPPLVWEAKGAGRGYSSISISGGMIYTMGDGPSTAEDKDEYLLAFQLATGKQAWKAKLGPAYNKHAKQESWNSSRSTPTVDGDHLYVLTGLGSLYCLSTTGGKEVWHKSMNEDFGGKKGDGWGYSESPLVDGDHLLCSPGGKSTMVCLNKKTGETVWTAQAQGNPGAGHASIVIAQVGKVKMYVNTNAAGAVGVRASDGKVQWTWMFPMKVTAVIPTPIVKGDLVFCTAGYGSGGVLLKQVPAEDGAVKMEEVYGLNSELKNKHGGVVLIGDFLYGDTDSNGSPWCAELMTGKQKWKSRGSGKGSASVTAAEGHLYIRYDNGQMVLAKASPESYEEVGSFKIPHSGERPSWSHPVVAGQKLFLREGDYLLCYDLKAKS